MHRRLALYAADVNNGGLGRWAEISGSVVTVPTHVVFRALAQETVLLDIRSGQYHGLDTVGGRFFELMRGDDTLEHVSAALAEEYEQPVERLQADLTTFVDELLSRGLVELASPRT